jgi:hypothetical protein
MTSTKVKPRLDESRRGPSKELGIGANFMEFKSECCQMDLESACVNALQEGVRFNAIQR